MLNCLQQHCKWRTTYKDQSFIGKEKEEQMDTTGIAENSTRDEVVSSHPFTYMLGNLMKKMDNKNIAKGTTKNVLDCETRAEKKRKMEQIGGGERNDLIQEYPQSAQIEYEQPSEEVNINLCEKTGKNLIPVGKIFENIKQNIFEQQPNTLIATREQNSDYERAIEESRAARQSVQNLLYQEQITEKKRLEVQLTKVTTKISFCLNL